MSFSFGFFDQEADVVMDYDTSASCTSAPAGDHISNNHSIDEETKARFHSFNSSLFDALKEEGIIYSTLSIEGKQFHRTITTNKSDLDKDSDIITGVYEGGYKVWECSVDLTRYILKNASQIQWQQSSVLELGCGHGLPGIAAFNLGSKHITFSDLNAEVIDNVLSYNILLNHPKLVDTIAALERGDDTVMERIISHLQASITCVSGDWDILSAHINNEIKFDVILSSETIYSSQSCEKLVQMLIKHLAPSGIALISTKRFYFGVGGGTAEFMRLMEHYPHFIVTVVETFEDGTSNIREILQVRLNS